MVVAVDSSANDASKNVTELKQNCCAYAHAASRQFRPSAYHASSGQTTVPVAPDSFKVVGGRDIVVALELLKHLLAYIRYRLVRGDKDAADVSLHLL